MSSDDIDLSALDSNAAEGTMWLFEDALTWLSGFCEMNDLEKLSPAQAFLIVGHAIVNQRERHHEERIQAEQSSGKDKERAVKDYDFLKWLVEKASPNLGEAEEAEARKRIIEIAGV